MGIRYFMVLFLAALLLVASLAGGQDVWSGVERIVAVGDAHGDYNGFVEVLRSAGLLDAKGKWSGGKSHLVQTGDVLDRGPDSRKIMDLLMELEKRARRAGGYVHALIGNHEAMNLYGDLRYVTAGEYAAFKSGNSQEIRDTLYKQHLEELKNSGSPPAIDAAYRQKWDEEHPLGFFEHRYQFGPKGEYGKWIRRHNAVIKINDVLFLHGGISPKFAASTLTQLNDTIRQELEDFTKLQGGAAMDEQGPLWYRGLASAEEAELEMHVEAVLKNFGVKKIVIGHTPTQGGIQPRFGGKVILIDVGISKYYGSGQIACLVLENGKAFALERGQRLEIP